MHSDCPIQKKNKKQEKMPRKDEKESLDWGDVGRYCVMLFMCGWIVCSLYAWWELDGVMDRYKDRVRREIALCVNQECDRRQRTCSIQYLVDPDEWNIYCAIRPLDYPDDDPQRINCKWKFPEEQVPCFLGEAHQSFPSMGEGMRVWRDIDLDVEKCHTECRDEYMDEATYSTSAFIKKFPEYEWYGMVSISVFFAWFIMLIIFVKEK